MATFTNLLVAQHERTLLITINRESKLNALNKDTLAELHVAFSDAFNNSGVDGIIVTGAGKKAFVAGADISEFAEFNADAGANLARTGQTTVFDLVANGNKPVIAAINGYALGGGLELAMACHIRIASSTARLGLPEVSLGLIPGYGGTQRLPLLAGKGKAMEMILTGDMIDAAEAYRIGLVNKLTSPDELMAEAADMMNRIGTRSPYAIAAAIRAINASGSEYGFENEIAEFGNCFDTEDFKEGVAAFLNKRPPLFKR